jgi:hypothetical protein
VVVRGLNGLFPSETGFQVAIEIMGASKKYDQITKPFWVHWQAMGY